MHALITDSLLEELNQLQQKILTKELPVLVIFEGCSGRVIGRVNSELIRCLEPRGVAYTHFDPRGPNGPRPIMDFFERMPSKGQIGLFDRSWYSSIIEEYGLDKKEKELEYMLSVSNGLERYLFTNGLLLIKILLKADEDTLKEYEEQYGPRLPKKSFLSMDHIDPEKYSEVMLTRVYEKTNTEHAPWHVVQVRDVRETVIEAAEIIKDVVEERLRSKPPMVVAPEIEHTYENPRKESKFDRKCPDYEDMIEKLSEELGELQMKLSMSNRSLVVCFEGWDAAGKGTCIKHLCHALNPRGYDVFQTKAPTEEELKHTYLWRFSKGIPARGHIVVFDRTWYGRMMVEHIEGFCTEEEYRRSPSEINALERIMVSNGTILLKFWLDVTPDEQLRRFKKRADDPLKQWKITDEDWRNRSKWKKYEAHVDVMMESTNTDYAKWTVVESNNKKYARVKVLRTVVETLKKELKD